VNDEFDGDIGTRWRVIGTDTERDSGVAPVCPDPERNHGGDPLDTWVYDCCPGPHLECWNEDNARDLAATLNRLGVEVCS
jgi:hypothetical protein